MEEIMKQLVYGALFAANIWCLMLMFVVDSPWLWGACAGVLLADYFCIRKG